MPESVLPDRDPGDMLLCPGCDGDGFTDSWGFIERCSLCDGSGFVSPDRCEEYHREMMKGHPCRPAGDPRA
ncbi:MAG: hypothetical protein PHP43_10400 [Methanoculleus sp.]|nr:hypothetical protein [Methanoculleus sp.]